MKEDEKVQELMGRLKKVAEEMDEIAEEVEDLEPGACILNPAGLRQFAEKTRSVDLPEWLEERQQARVNPSSL